MSSDQAASALAEVLLKKQIRVVFAESCTAGLVSAKLAMTPRISDYHCGSAVTYREQTKQDWLDVSAADLAEFSAVSEPVALQMAYGVLNRTPEAEWSAAITGHLGPNAPDGFDGLVFVAVAKRTESGIVNFHADRHILKTVERVARQEEAAALVLNTLKTAVE